MITFYNIFRISFLIDVLFFILIFLIFTNLISYNSIAHFSPFSLTIPYFLLLIILLILLYFKDNTTDSKVVFYTMFILLYLAYGLFIGMVWNENSKLVNVFDIVKNSLISLLTFIVVNKYFRFKKDLGKVNNMLIFTVFISSLIAIYGLIYQIDFGEELKDDVSWEFVTRASGLFLNPNPLGFIIIIAIIIIICNLIFSKKYLLFNYILLISFIVFGLMTFSKTYIFSLLILLIIVTPYIYKEFMRFKFSNVILLSKLIFILLIPIFIYYEEIYTFFDKLDENQLDRLLIFTKLSSGNASEITTARSEIFFIGLRKILSNPILGYGLGSFELISETSKVHGGKAQGIHNQYLLIWGNSGLFFIIFYILLLLNIIKISLINVKKHLISKKHGFLALVVILIFMFYGFTSHNFFESYSQSFILAYIFFLSNN